MAGQVISPEARRIVREACPLDRARFARLLTEQQVDPRAFDLQGSNAGEQFVMDHSSLRGWSVHYAERGLRRDEEWFDTESDALAELARRILSDLSTRVRNASREK
jgi:hypothetical protein